MFSGGGFSADDTPKIAWVLILTLVTPIVFAMIVPTTDSGAEWEAEVADLENTYYRQTGINTTADMNIWALTGIYTAYEAGGTYGYTDDGWLYGQRVVTNTPSQYNSQYWAAEQFTVSYNPDNGLYYYTDAATNQPDITAATVTDGVYDYTGATLYSNVTMDSEHKSDIFFTTTGKTEVDNHYYYEYTGWRYAFQPLTNYTTTSGGITYDIDASTSSCSLIWYQYTDLSGIAGQLTISSKDFGVSYLTSDDIIRAYNGTNFTATFDMRFGNIPMHILISLNPTAVAAGLSIPQIWNAGYWSVMVYSDADPVTSVLSQSSTDFSPDKVLDIIVDLFTYDIVDTYDIDGWVAIVAAAAFNLPIYANLLALCLRHKEVWLIFAIILALQSFKFWR